MFSLLGSAIMVSQIRGGALAIAILWVASAFLASAASNDGEIHSLQVVGSVFCDTCFLQEFSKSSYFIKGAPVAVECETQKEGPKFRIEAKTNKHGKFEVKLPPSVFHSETQLKRCSATLLRKEGPCRTASIANASSFTLKSKKGGIHTYSAGFFTYRPQILPTSCSNEVANPKAKKNDIEASRRSEFESSKQFGFPIPPLLSPFFPSPPPPPPVLPLPKIPSLPPLPPIPFLTPSPPPSLIPPIPFLSPPPSLIPPIPFLSPPPSLIPPIPFLTPPPSLVPPIGTVAKSLQPPTDQLPIPLVPDLPIPLVPDLPIPPIPALPIPPVPLVPIPPIPLIPPAQHTLKSHPAKP